MQRCKDGYRLAVESRMRVSSCSGLVSWIFLQLRVDVHSATRIQYRSLQTPSRTWNVWTMWETRKISQIATEMRRYNLAVLGISETHWTQAGQQRLDMGEMLLYSSHEEENASHTQGVALMLSNAARNALVGWKSHGSRIIKASFETKKEGITMNIIQCYAPTNDIADDNKDQFYDRLQSIIVKCSRKDRTILIGDLNAKVGIDNTGYEDIMGRHGLTGREKRK
ncbi:unnamed protein product [Schistosoma margrebowiei]|uniref:Uncharacterized protein n=1 Tax=Schistosoma margrebowiei TaxID=48269 RepID=A0A183MYT2_9TREM|nr:unnamed protein product [Schistosoma margrebowiei]